MDILTILVTDLFRRRSLAIKREMHKLAAEGLQGSPVPIELTTPYQYLVGRMQELTRLAEELLGQEFAEGL